MKFKVGDRVACYEPRTRMTGTVEENPNSNWTEVVWVNIGAGRKEFFNPKQCRRLAKKKRREIWVHTDDITRVMSVGDAPSGTICLPSGTPGNDIFCKDQGTGYVKFIEAKTK